MTAGHPLDDGTLEVVMTNITETNTTDETHDHSQLNEAVEKANTQQIKENLDKKNSGLDINDAATLNSDQQTPFIDESVRTDK